MSRLSWKQKALMLSGVLVVGLGSLAVVTAQEEPAAEELPLMLPGCRYDLPAVLIKAAQIQEHLRKSVEAEETGVPLTVADVGGSSGTNHVSVGIIYRDKGGPRPNFSVHDKVAEVHYVLEGRGHMTVGGTIEDWHRRPYSSESGPGSGGTKAEGGQQITIEAGDVLIIPAGTPHKWDGADELTAYVSIRIDPEGLTALQALGDAKFE